MPLAAAPVDAGRRHVDDRRVLAAVIEELAPRCG